MTQEQRRELIREQLKETPEKSDRQIASELDISHHTVAAQRRELENIGQIAQCSRQTSDGRIYPATRKPVSVFNPTKREEKALQNPEVVERLQEQNSRASLSHLAPLSAVVISTYKNINAERF